MKNNSSLIYNLFLIVGDFFALLVAFVGAYIIRVSLSHRALIAPVNSRTYLGVFIVLLPFWILIFALLGLYDSNIYEKRFSEAGRLFVGTFIGMLFVVFWNFISTSPILPARSVPLIGFILSFILIILFRNLARLIRTTLFSYEVGLTNVLVVGNTARTDDLVNLLHDSKRSGYQVVGIVSSHVHHPENSKNLRHFSTFNGALEAIKAESIHTIIQTELYADENKNREILDFAQSNHIGYRFVPGNTELFVGNIDVELFRSAMPVIAVHQTALFGWGRIAKRVFDLIFGSIALIIASPFMLIIAIILLLDHGDVIFTDTRLTRFDSKVKIYKFRTFKHEFNTLGPEEAFTKMGHPELIEKYRKNGDWLQSDPRINRFGEILRKISLDELPQLINIIKGDISLVGPRALQVYELAQYPKKNLLLSVKSGLTGLAQVSGRRNLSFEERRNLDLYYVQNWSFWLDITILLKTIRVIINRKGAV